MCASDVFIMYTVSTTIFYPPNPDLLTLKVHLTHSVWKLPKKSDFTVRMASKHFSWFSNTVFVHDFCVFHVKKCHTGMDNWSDPILT